MRRLPLVDSLRALAFGSVLATHAALFAGLEAPGVTLRPFFARLDVGLYIFFVISGFLIYRPFVAAHLGGGRSPRPAAYTWRRLLRIVPPYWIALTAIGIWFGLPHLFDLRHGPLYYGFAYVYDPGSLGLQPIPQAWTLCVEVTFYAFLPLYAALVRSAPGRSRARVELVGLAALAALALGFNAAIGPPPGSLGAVGPIGSAGVRLHLMLPAYVDVFAAGMGLAVLSVHYERRAAPRALRVVDARPWLPWLGALAAFVVVSRGIGLAGFPTDAMNAAQSLARHYLYALVAIGVVLPAVFGDPRRGVVRRLLGWRPLLYVGMVSYSAYLFEFAVLNQLSSWGFGDVAHATSPYVWFAAALAGSVAIAAVSWYAVERPLLGLKRRVPGSPRVETPAAA